MRLFLGAFGDPGHAFPMLALGSELARRGHRVTMETWSRWRADVEAAGMTFVAAPEYPVFPTMERPMTMYEAVVRAVSETRPAVAEARPHAVVHDILTLAPALAGELEGMPVATLIPHVHPAPPSGAPPYSFGARWPRTRLGRRMWRQLDPLVEKGLRYGQRELNETRAQLGLPPVERVHGGLSDRLVLVGTYPQLEYPRDWPAHTHVVGPLLWEPPSEPVELPPGEQPLVLVAPSTAQDREHRLLRAALDGLGDLPIRVLATWNRRPLEGAPVTVPDNTRLVEWVSYSRTMPAVRARRLPRRPRDDGAGAGLGRGGRRCPVAGDMGENAARLDWAGAGVRLPWRLLTPATLRLAVQRALSEPALTRRAGELAAWSAANDAAARAADLVERLAREGSRWSAAPTLRRGGGRVGRRPGDDLARLVDRVAVVGHQQRDPRLTADALDLAAGRIDRVGESAEAVRSDDLWLVAGLAQRGERVAAGMTSAWDVERPPADVELHRAPPRGLERPYAVANGSTTANGARATVSLSIVRRHSYWPTPSTRPVRLNASGMLSVEPGLRPAGRPSSNWPLGATGSPLMTIGLPSPSSSCAISSCGWSASSQATLTTIASATVIAWPGA